MRLEKIMKIYEKSKIEDCRLGTELPLDVVNFKTSVDDVNAFCEILPEILEEKYETYLARYLTTLIQKCNSKKIILNLPIPLNDVGYRLEDKKIIVNGSVGNLGFMYARNSSAEINGNAGNLLGYIADGCLFKVINGAIGKNPLKYARNCKVELIKI